jgi:hypothetical protein
MCHKKTLNDPFGQLFASETQYFSFVEPTSVPYGCVTRLYCLNS